MPNEDPSQPRVLIIDDDEGICRSLGLVLNRSGYRAEHATTGRAGSEAFIRQSHDIVLLDICLPDMDGMSLLEKVRRRSDQVVVMVLTGHASLESSIRALDEGASAYIVKPVDMDDLLARLRESVEKLRLARENKRLEAQLIQSEKMASIGQLASGVAHEINNPAGFVISNLNTFDRYMETFDRFHQTYRELMACLEKEAAGTAGRGKTLEAEILRAKSHIEPLDLDFVCEDSRELIAECRDGMQRISKIVGDLKNFAHPGKDEIEYVDLNACLETSLNIVWNEIKYKARVHKHFGRLQPVACLPQKLNQVVMNLLVNAAQAIESRGHITLTTRTDDRYAEVTVADTGSGIPPEIQGRIFDPFFTTKDVGQGTGLGLNVAYNVMQQHGGTIAVESEVGRGTTFRLRLPVEPLQSEENTAGAGCGGRSAARAAETVPGNTHKGGTHAR